jgi:N-methylhydantoinase A
MLNALFAEMRAEAEAVVRLGAPQARLREVRTAFMRYRGQGHEVAVALPAADFGTDAATLLRGGFEAAYDALYGRTIPGLEMEALTWTLALAEEKPLPARRADAPEATAPAPRGARPITDPGGNAVQAALYDRAALPPGARVSGPAIIQEAETATLVPEGFRAWPTAAGHILIERIAP